MRDWKGHRGTGMEINGAEQRTQGRTHTNMHNWFLTNTQKQLSGGRSLSNRLTQLTLTGRKTSLAVYIKINAKWTTGVKYKTIALLEKGRGKSSGSWAGQGVLRRLRLDVPPAEGNTAKRDLVKMETSVLRKTVLGAGRNKLPPRGKYSRTSHLTRTWI